MLKFVGTIYCVIVAKIIVLRVSDFWLNFYIVRVLKKFFFSFHFPSSFMFISKEREAFVG